MANDNQKLEKIENYTICNDTELTLPLEHSDADRFVNDLVQSHIINDLSASFSVSLGSLKDTTPLNNNISKSSDDISLINEESKSQSVRCDVCIYKKLIHIATSHCSVCNLNFCLVCRQNHDAHSLFKAHSMVPVSHASCLPKCDQHNTEPVRYYCTSCLLPMCAVCAVSDHMDHTSVEMTSALKNKKEVIESGLSVIMERVGKQEELLSQLEDIENAKEVAHKKLRAEVEKHTDKLITRLMNRKTELLETIELNHVEDLRLLNAEKENSSSTLINMKSLWKFALRLLEPGRSVQLMAAYPDLMAMVDRTTKCQEPRIPKEVSKMQMFVPHEGFTIGDLRQCEMSPDLLRRISGIQSPGRPSSPTCDQSLRIVEMDLPQSPLGSRYLSTAQLVWSVDKVGSKVGEINEVYHVAIGDDGTVYTAEWLNQRVQLFHGSTGCSKQIIGQGQMQPWGIAVNADGNIVVTDEKHRTVKVFNHEGSLVTSWRRNTFGWPRGIAVGKEHLVVTDAQHGRHTVNILSQNGRLIHQFEGGGPGRNSEQFHWPRYVACDSTGRILVSDGANHCLKIFNDEGRFLLKVGSFGSADGHLRHPRGVCVDPNSDNILVADHDNDRISMFSKKGIFLRHILRIAKPRGLSISGDGLMAVSTKSSLSLYRIFENSV